MSVSSDSVTEAVGFVAEIRPALVKYFHRKTGNRAEAEDLAQDVLVRALSHAHWKSPEQAKGYLFRSAVNRWRDYLRRRRSHGINVSWDDHSALSVGVESSPERVLAVREQLTRVVRVLDGLPSRTRTILVLIKFEQMKAASVAELLGISVSAVNKHLAAAIAALAVLHSGHEKS